MAYVHHVDLLERSTFADRTGYLVAAAMSSDPKSVELPDLNERRDQFDAALAEPPAQLSDAHRLLREWGVR